MIGGIVVVGGVVVSVVGNGAVVGVAGGSVGAGVAGAQDVASRTSKTRHMQTTMDFLR